MELDEGPTLADRIAQGVIPIDAALPIARQIAGMLEAAHERSVRDADRQARLRREDMAEGLSISRSTVTREWQTARAWMHRHRRLTDGRAQGDS
jgi:hypothetical protein